MSSNNEPTNSEILQALAKQSEAITALAQASLQPQPAQPTPAATQTDSSSKAQRRLVRRAERENTPTAPIELPKDYDGDVGVWSKGWGNFSDSYAVPEALLLEKPFGVIADPEDDTEMVVFPVVSARRRRVSLMAADEGAIRSPTEPMYGINSGITCCHIDTDDCINVKGKSVRPGPEMTAALDAEQADYEAKFGSDDENVSAEANVAKVEKQWSDAGMQASQPAPETDAGDLPAEDALAAADRRREQAEAAEAAASQQKPMSEMSDDELAAEMERRKQAAEMGEELKKPPSRHAWKSRRDTEG